MRKSVVLLSMVPAMLLGTAVESTPMVPGKGSGPYRWPDGSVITVCIPKDPKDKGRDAALAAGVTVWNDAPALKARGISIVTVSGCPKKPARNQVTLTWSATPFVVTYADGKTETVDGLAGPNARLQGGKVVTIGGSISIHQDEALTDEDMRRLGAHEMGHVLGIDESLTEGDLMYYRPGRSTPTEADLLELGAIYTAAADRAEVVPNVLQIDGVWQYRYDLAWQEGSALALFQIDLKGADIFDILVPDGWAAVDERAAPTAIPSLHAPFANGNRIAFVLDDGQSYLSESNPLLSFGFSSRLGPGQGSYFLLDLGRTIVPVPEPGSWAMLIAGFFATGAAMRGRRAIALRGLRP